MIFVDGVDIGDPDDVALRDRRMLSADGVFIVVATVSSDDGSTVAPAEVMFRGVPFVEEADGLVDELREVVEASLAKAAREEVREVSLLQQDLHDDVAEFVYDRLRRRPHGAPRRGRGLADSRLQSRQMRRFAGPEKKGPPGSGRENPAGRWLRLANYLTRQAKRWGEVAGDGSLVSSWKGRLGSFAKRFLKKAEYVGKGRAGAVQARPSASYSRRKPSNRRRWPSSSWRTSITMSWVTGSTPSVTSMILL